MEHNDSWGKRRSFWTGFVGEEDLFVWGYVHGEQNRLQPPALPQQLQRTSNSDNRGVQGAQVFLVGWRGESNYQQVCVF